MKLLSTLMKNFKLIARSKSSALVVLLAPLLIVAIVGVGFTDFSQTTLNVGIHASNSNNLTQRFIDSINTTENHIITYTTEKGCVENIKSGVILACIIFPENFVIKNNKTNEVKVYVDESRINLAYKIISSLSSNLNVESGQVSQELTSQLLQIMNRSSSQVENSLAKIISLKAKSQQMESARATSHSQLSNLNVSEVNVDVSGLSDSASSIQSDFTSLRNRASSTVTKGYALLAVITYNGTEKSDLESALSSLNSSVTSTNTTLTALTNFVNKISDVQTSVDALQTQLAQSRAVKSTVLANLNTMSDNLKQMTLDLDSVKKKQESILNDINSFHVTNAGNIVNPITTKIETVSSSNSKLTFSFPYLLMLIIMFVGMMLSSTLIFMEKDSRAFFRNFTLPTKSSFFMATTFLTSLIILLVQVLVVLLLVNFGLNVPVFNNILISTIFILLSITFFIFLGMFIGYLFSSSEGITMSTITIGSILIFFSNLILPLETLSPIIQRISLFNPYVIASEGIRKATLFGLGFSSLYRDMITLLAYCIILITLTVVVKKVISSKYLEGFHHRFHKGKINVPEDHYLVLYKGKIIIKNIQGLIDALEKLSDSKYQKLIKPKNVFANWLGRSLKARFLSFRIRGKKRKVAIDILRKYMQHK